jgi:hypothetical protein
MVPPRSLSLRERDRVRVPGQAFTPRPRQTTCTFMKAENETLREQIRASLDLLRRHL